MRFTIASDLMGRYISVLFRYFAERLLIKHRREVAELQILLQLLRLTASLRTRRSTRHACASRRTPRKAITGGSSRFGYKSVRFLQFVAPRLVFLSRSQARAPCLGLLAFLAAVGVSGLEQAGLVLAKTQIPPKRGAESGAVEG